MRTSRKAAIKQLTQIERRQARIHRIRQNLDGRHSIKDSDIAVSPDVRYHVGSTQNHPENIPLFLQKHAGDPAIKVSHFIAASQLQISHTQVQTEFCPSLESTSSSTHQKDKS
jgi:hypothetical protein